MIKHALKLVWMLAVLCGVGCTHAPRQPETMLFVGNSFTYGALSSVQHYRPETVIDLNQDGMGGVPALFESFARQAGLHCSARLASLFRSKNPHVDVRLVATWSRADQTFLPSGHWFGKPIEAMAQDLRAACDRAAENSPSIRAVVPPAPTAITSRRW
jgi:hypothetical protein